MEEDRAQVDVGLAADIEEAQANETPADAPNPVPAPLKQPKKRFVGRRAAADGAAKSNPGAADSEDNKAIQGKEYVCQA